ncbi:MAG: phosphomannomutase/phosphoglucomutase [Firmicutes bacterium]|nr:phosphomannomutase/phosphoglucomutase [Bacillota bacterium]
MGGAGSLSKPELKLHVFKEYDIRGEAYKDLTPDFACLLGYAFGKMVKEEKGFNKAIIGRDNRESSPELAEGLVTGLRRAGVEVVDIGQVVTPVFYWSRIYYDINPGIMVTASHNPPKDNGFKIALGFATIYGEDVQNLRRRMEALIDEYEKEPSELPPVRKERPNPEYIKMVAEKVKLDRPLKVAVDCGNGTASDIAVDLYEALGCEVIPLYCESNPSFPNHHPDPVRPENLQDLIKVVKENQADVGLAFDGDGDRLGVVDDTGNILWGDQLMVLYWREILPKHPGAEAIVEVKCSNALVDEVKKLGGRPFFYRTGHSYIKAKLKEIGAPFTGEMSGHLFFADEYYGFDDALYAGARLLRILAREDKPLSRLLDDVPKYYSTPEVRVHCREESKTKVVKAVLDHFREKYEVIDVDGARVNFPNGGWGLVRASNTQPVLVLRCEAKTKEDLGKITGEIEEVLEKFPEVGEINWK